MIEKKQEKENLKNENNNNESKEDVSKGGNWGNEAFAEKYDGLGINDYTFEEYASYELGY